MDRLAHQQIRSQLQGQPRAAPLFVYFIIDVCMIALVGWLVSMRLSFLTIPIVATLMFRNFGLMHDAVHGAVSKRRWLNDAVGLWSGCLSLLPFQTWRQSHLEHHRWSGNIDKDPVMALRVVLPKAPQMTQKFLTFCWKSWIPMLAFLQYLLFWRLSLKPCVSSQRARQFFAFMTPLTAWALMICALPNHFVLGGLIPGVVFYFVSVEVVNFPHHLQLPMIRGSSRLPIWEQDHSSRTCLYPKWLARLCVLNFNYHVEHHLFPDIPWYELERVHFLVSKALSSKQNVDVNFEWTVKNRPRNLVQLVTPSEFVESESSKKRVA